MGIHKETEQRYTCTISNPVFITIYFIQLEMYSVLTLFLLSMKIMLEYLELKYAWKCFCFV